MDKKNKLDHLDGMSEEPLQELSDLTPGTPDYVLKLEYEDAWREINEMKRESVSSWSEQVLIELDRWESDNSVRRRNRFVISTVFCLLASFGLIPFQIPFIEVEIKRVHELIMLIILFFVQIFCYWSYNITIRQRNIRIALIRAVNNQNETLNFRKNRVYRLVDSSLREMRFFYKQVPRLMFYISGFLLIVRGIYTAAFQ
jgi:hypothetical protein